MALLALAFTIRSLSIIVARATGILWLNSRMTCYFVAGFVQGFVQGVRDEIARRRKDHLALADDDEEAEKRVDRGKRGPRELVSLIQVVAGSVLVSLVAAWLLLASLEQFGIRLLG